VILSEPGVRKAICRAHDVPLPAAAMQFVLTHPAIASFVAGMRTVAQLVQNVNWLGHPIPAAFWSDLKAKGLLREDAPTPVQ
jgi:D-threo-aldose 1-dehydrogenase